MKNINISTKIVLLLLVPFFLIAVYAIKTGNDNYQEWRNSAATESLMDLAISLGNLTHRLQIERGATAGFIQSKGAKFAGELPEYRTETDKKIAELKAQYAKSGSAGLPQTARNAVDGILSALDKLGNTRAAASGFNIPVAEATGYYTQTIASVLNTIPVIAEQTSNPVVARQVSAYLSLLQTKERNGQQRALLAGVFTANKIEPAQYRALLSHIAAQQAYLAGFNSFASDEARELYKQKMAGEFINEVESMQKTVIEKSAEGEFGIEPAKWFSSMTAKINAMHDVEEKFADQIRALASTQAGHGRTAFILCTVLNIVLLLALVIIGYRVVLSITRPIMSLKAGIIEIQANNDLVKRLNVHGNDEIGQVAEAFNQLVGNLQSIICQVNANAHQVLELSTRLTENSVLVASSSQNQSDSASSMAATVEEMTVSIDQISQHAGEAQSISSSSNELAVHGSDVILKVAEDMRSIADTVHASSDIIEELGQQSNQIHSIVQAIQEIAKQTNLLALNAAIEAARAGEQGRGFAVVADEVRKLATRTATATEEIASVILKIQEGTKQAVDSMSIGVERVNEGVTMAGQASSSIQQIQSGSQQVSKSVTDISSALKEQSLASTEIASHVEQVAQMAEQNNSVAQSNAKTARQMEELAANLQEAIEKFRV